MDKYKGHAKVWFLLLLLVAFVAGCGYDNGKQSSAKAITAYSLAGVDGAIDGTIDGTAITVTVPNGTDVTALIATFSTTGTGVKVGTEAQTSGTTANDFANHVGYTVTAEDHSTATYTVIVTEAAVTSKAITAYALNGVAGAIDQTAKTIAVTLPYGTNVTALIATFSATATNVKVDAEAQVSKTTANNFTNPVAYTVTAQDTSTAIYTVTVVVPSDSDKAITAYSLNGVAGTIGTISPTAKTIAVTLPYGTNKTALIATFSATATSVKVGAVAQVSKTTKNNFTNPVAYTVTAHDGSTAIYTVAVTVAANPAKAITAYALAGATGVINKTAKTIAVTVPNGTDVSALIATFSATATDVKIGVDAQTSGITSNNFTNTVAYTVTAQDGSTAIYTVTVTIAALTAKEMTTYSLKGVAGIIDGSATPKTIAVTLPNGTNVTALVATFTTTGTAVNVDTAPQVSTSTKNNFTAPVTYKISAGDATTPAEYVVTVTFGSAKGPAAVDLGTAGQFVILAKTGVSTTGTTAVVGDIGLSPAAASYITGFDLIADSTNTFSTSSLVTGQIYAADYAVPTPDDMTTAIGDMEIAFTDAAGRSNPDFTELYAGDISGRTLVPGLYKWGTGVLITAGGVTLSGGANDVWIFQIAQDLTVSNSAIVTLIGGAQAKNIFWQVSGQATLGTAADFKGILLSQTLISLNTGAKMLGRTLAQTAVTLNATAITAPAQ